MRKDLTDVVMVVDRSGSMAFRKDDAEKGVNAFLEQQRKDPGVTRVTLVQFDNVYEFVHRGVDARDVGPFVLSPRGSTALLDAVGRAIVETGDRLKILPERERPGLVAFVIVTDGEENASKEFTLDRLKEMITHQTDVYKWQFTFIGANQDAFAAAGGMGIPAAAALNFAEEKTSGAYRVAANNFSRMKAATARGVAPDNAYTDKERAEVAPETPPSPSK